MDLDKSKIILDCTYDSKFKTVKDFTTWFNVLVVSKSVEKCAKAQFSNLKILVKSSLF